MAIKRLHEKMSEIEINDAMFFTIIPWNCKLVILITYYYLILLIIYCIMDWCCMTFEVEVFFMIQGLLIFIWNRSRSRKICPKKKDKYFPRIFLPSLYQRRFIICPEWCLQPNFRNHEKKFTNENATFVMKAKWPAALTTLSF